MSDQVKVYALSTCIHCRNTKEFLKKCGVEYDCVDVDTLTGEERDRIVEEVRRLNPELTFPTVVIGDRIIVGFKEKELREALGLDED
ncbi:glutaredoxin family protein [Thermodesulforhabdus norvegica]|uniref:Glutaredoxin n=1 Tax=Thermodesulforhabdus norvegica TaxID=39841 RepID=A0A1I4RBM1_9BACT|nr:glutaredoxin family protein [Thermodesulforhabdus norvegica]SFM49436.1 Glutaredoxin [Thermodesulforhabdus norvegica]